MNHSLAALNSDRRQSPRVKCRSRSGVSADFAILDISAGGLMTACVGWTAKPGDRVLATLPGLAAQPMELIWKEDGRAGLAFEQPLHEAVLDRLCAVLRLDNSLDFS